MTKMYKYELHCHTGPVSRCAKIEPKKLVRLYADKGYDGIVLTDHYSPMTFLKSAMLFPQFEKKHFLASYRELKNYCGKDFTVLLGMEHRHYFVVNDYLIYGIDEDFILNHGNMLLWSERKVYNEIHKIGGLVYQAHPFRPLIYPCNPKYIDGVEILNGHTADELNQKAALWAKEIGKPVISGSDFHTEGQPICGGICTDTKITSNEELVDVLKNGRYELVWNR